MNKLPSELRPQLETLYRQLFGSIIGADMVKGGQSIRQHCLDMNEDDLKPMWEEFDQFMQDHNGGKLNDHDRLYVWAARFSDVLTYLTFNINRRSMQ